MLAVYTVFILMLLSCWPVCMVIVQNNKDNVEVSVGVPTNRNLKDLGEQIVGLYREKFSFFWYGETTSEVCPGISGTSPVLQVCFFFNCE